MDGLTIRLRRDEDDEQAVALGNRAEPRFPPSTVEEVRRRRQLEPKDLFLRRWVGERDGHIVAVGMLGEIRSEVPGAYRASITVDPELRGQGIGTAMAEAILPVAGETGARRLYGYVAEDRPEALAFARRHGFDLTGKGERLSRLDVHTANLDGFVEVEDRLAREGLRIQTLAEIGTDNHEFMKRLYDLDSQTQRDIPGSEVWTMGPFEEWLKETLNWPGVSPEAYWVALDGDRPVGTALLARQGPNAAWNAYTSVDRAYRGKGIARALKLRTVEWARRNGVDLIYTGNNAENHRMLAINISLGYQMLPREVEVVKIVRP